MTSISFPNDPLWPRAGHWLQSAAADTMPESDLAVLGVPAYRSSISPTGASATPVAVRDALMRYSTYAASRDADIAALTAIDLGDIDEPDGAVGEARVGTIAAAAAEHARLLIALGGDNSITYSVMSGVAGGRLRDWGLITVDAHHDLRDGENNGSPVRRLIEAGLPGAHVVQIGIADFANSAAYTARAHEYGITVISRVALQQRALAEVAEEALRVAGADGRPVYVDLDVDVCDRSCAPACPASAPGGISAHALRELAFVLASDARVKALDITEVDATSDAPDDRTIRLAALLVLEAAAGLASRPAS